ncbi:MAG: ArsR family transcriptional regulator [Anaerolineae bacterium]|nr:ArsR family transcriptional regulator [Anaerolineae bacterium]
MEIQETRRHILEVLKERGECTVDEIVEALSVRRTGRISTVTVRHHLERLRADELVKPPQVRHRSTPGRPQYVYALSERALDYFPNNYAGLASGLLDELKRTLPTEQVNVILEGMAEHMAHSANIPNASLSVRLDYAVAFLSDRGYQAAWHRAEDGFVLETSNCPYEQVAGCHAEMCAFDLRLMSALLGVRPRFLSKLRDGADSCRYLISTEPP